jgi:hypothetical protein
MIISKCPCCHEAVTIPNAPRESRARCPLCREEYTLAEALERCPPELELLDVPDTADDGFGGYPLAAAGISGVDKGGFESDNAPSSFDFSESPAPGGASAAATVSAKASPAAKTSTRSAARRPRSKGKNPVIEIVKVVGGGALGLFIAQMLLWWLPFNLSTNQRDPTSLGRNIGRYVPWLVPAQVRGDDEPAAASAADGGGRISDKDAAALKDDSVWGQAAREQARSEKAGGRAASRNNAQGGRGGRGNQQAKNNGAGNKPTTNTGLNGAALPDLAVLPESSQDPSASSQDDPFGEEESLLDPENLVDPELIDVEVPSPTKPDSPAGTSKPSGRTSGWKTPGKRTEADVAQAFQQASQANQAYDSAPEDTPNAEKIALANNLYASLAQLGVVLGHVDQNRLQSLTPHLKDLNEFLTSLGENKYNGLSYLASNWLSNDNRANQGVVLVGTVQAVEPIGGDYYRSRISLSGDKNVEVIGWVAPQAEFGPGARVLILGAIVDDAGDKLIGFSGSGGQAICGSFSQVLAPATADDAPDPPAN